MGESQLIVPGGAQSRQELKTVDEIVSVLKQGVRGHTDAENAFCNWVTRGLMAVKEGTPAVVDIGGREYLVTLTKAQKLDLFQKLTSDPELGPLMVNFGPAAIQRDLKAIQADIDYIAKAKLSASKRRELLKPLERQLKELKTAAQEIPADDFKLFGLSKTQFVVDLEEIVKSAETGNIGKLAKDIAAMTGELGTMMKRNWSKYLVKYGLWTLAIGATAYGVSVAIKQANKEGYQKGFADSQAKFAEQTKKNTNELTANGLLSPAEASVIPNMVNMDAKDEKGKYRYVTLEDMKQAQNKVKPEDGMIRMIDPFPKAKDGSAMGATCFVFLTQEAANQAKLDNAVANKVLDKLESALEELVAAGYDMQRNLNFLRALRNGAPATKTAPEIKKLPATQIVDLLMNDKDSYYQEKYPYVRYPGNIEGAK